MIEQELEEADRKQWTSQDACDSLEVEVRREECDTAALSLQKGFGLICFVVVLWFAVGDVVQDHGNHGGLYTDELVAGVINRRELPSPTARLF